MDEPRREKSIIWTEDDRYKDLNWASFKAAIKSTHGGIGIAAADFIEMLGYRPAPFREKTWVLRNELSKLVSDAKDDEDLSLIAKIANGMILEGYYIDVGWLIVRMRTANDRIDAARGAKVLNHLFYLSEEATRWAIMGLGNFVESFDPIVKSLDLIVKTGLLHPKVIAMINRPSVFISYAREDIDVVIHLHEELTSAGFKPWLDVHDLLPGEEWERKIEGAQKVTDFMILCLSKKSISKIGFFQVEIKRALQWQEYRPTGRAFLIPVRIDKCEVPDSLARFQYVDLFPEFDTGIKKLSRAIDLHWKAESGT